MSDQYQSGIVGNYQDGCAAITEELEADCVMLVVVGGIRGEGFSVSARGGRAPDLHTDEGIARYLRMLADRVEKRGRRGVNLRAVSEKGQKS